MKYKKNNVESLYCILMQLMYALLSFVVCLFQHFRHTRTVSECVQGNLSLSKIYTLMAMKIVQKRNQIVIRKSIILLYNLSASITVTIYCTFLFFFCLLKCSYPTCNNFPDKNILDRLIFTSSESKS